MFSAVGAAGGALGTFLGGALTQAVGWHWIFLINLPIGVVAWLAALRILAPGRGAGLGKGADYPGAALVTGALMLTVYAIVGAGDRGLGGTLALAAVSLALFVAFTVRQARADRPLLRLRLFRSRLLTGANGVQILMVAAMFGFQHIGALYLQRVLGHSELMTGTAFLPAPLLIGVLMLGLSARTIGRFGPYRVLLAGLVLSTAGQAMSGALEEDAGLASGLFNTTQVVGGSLGLAVLTTLAASRTDGLPGDGESLVAAAADGYRLAFTVGTGIAGAGLVLAAAVLRPGRASSTPEPEKAEERAEVYG